MDTTGGRDAASDPYAIQRQLQALIAVSRRRRLLRRGTPEYEDTLAEEERIATAIWQRERLTR